MAEPTPFARALAATITSGVAATQRDVRDVAEGRYTGHHSQAWLDGGRSAAVATACVLCHLDPARGWASATVDGRRAPLCHPPVGGTGHRDCYREWTVYGRRPVPENVVLGEE